MSLTTIVNELAWTDIFAIGDDGRPNTGLFMGRPFYLDYDQARLLVADAWKRKANGIPQGCFLLAYYDNEEDVKEALLLRVLRPASLPTDSDVIASMVEYYKDNLRTSGASSQLDQFTRYEFSFSGVECRVLGTFYIGQDGKMHFGADVENFYSAHNYQVLKPNADVLELVANFREGGVTGQEHDIRIGKVRYSSSQRFQTTDDDVPVYVSPKDFLGKRTALFGMTRTGKSNTVKKIIQSTVAMSDEAAFTQESIRVQSPLELLEPFTEFGLPKLPVGQIVFDINGEYANPNMQDSGTAIYEIYKDKTTRYSVLEKSGFRVMKVNFYTDIEAGFELVRSHLDTETGDYIRSFTAVALSEPEDPSDHSATTRYARKRAAYLCCLYKAGFEVPKNFRVTFSGREDINKLVREDGSLDPSKGLTLQEATTWFSGVWDNYDNGIFSKYKAQKGYEWADEDLKSILMVLTRKTKPGGNANVSGHRKLDSLRELHTASSDKPFDEQIIKLLRDGMIVIVDLSQGDPKIQRLYSERICQRIFSNSMERFINNESNNFIQFYFEEAHNLFPKKDEKDLSQIYNRLAKEGAKLGLGLVYATQEVSSISANILKNTQNWFIAHLNNEDETKEIRKYYDFADFTESLIRFSADTDKGFVRMKTYSNPYVVPVQIDRFLA